MSAQKPSRRIRVSLWIAQSLLAALFLFAGSMKFIMPVEAMTQQMPVHLPVWFIHFIGIAEIAGALGLILPTLLRIQPQLTALAAAGLVIIMAGATVISAIGSVAGAAVPFVVGLLCAFIVYGRTRVVPVAPAARTHRRSLATA